MGGKKHRKGGSLANFAADIEKASVAFHNALNRRKTEAGSFAGHFGCEKRFEDFFQHVRCNAVAGIGNGNRYVRTGNGLELQGSYFTLERCVIRSQFERAAAGHRVARIDAEIQQYLAHLSWVAKDREELRMAMDLSLDGARKCLTGQFLHFQ